jgi:F-type H+-transporting ATPase subunit b
MDINLTLVMQAVAFAAFIWFTAKFVWPPLMRAVETRQKQIADGIAAGEEGRHSLASAEKRIADMMTEAKGRSSEIIAQGEKLKSETVEAAKAEAKAEADRILAAAKAEIQQEMARAKESLRDQVADLAVAGASKILRREVDAKAHADLLAAIRKEL